ncbi:biotin synthase [Neokomagataea tanensis]|uniref:Biotin synthase n=1 Tax=Neokomagataea tanensis TaxID=661191 RepID=A0A4Y6V8P5_9PROT|nr:MULTISPECIES: biotin synthase [Neokomagataea]QDH24857.1 biotin synthase [Neokomagataea tanensis]
MTLPLYLVHGWSYDQHFWDAMLHQLPEYESHCVDKGYFSSPHTPPLPTRPFLAIGHSAGVLDLLSQPLPNCVGLVSFNGFARFCFAPDFTDGVPARVITRMRRQLLQNTEQVVTTFRAQCGDTNTLNSPPLAPALEQGLIALETLDHRAEACQLGEAIFWLSGAEDPLSPARRGFKNNAGRTCTGGHLLPQEQPALCADFIRTTLQSLGYAS